MVRQLVQCDPAESLRHTHLGASGRDVEERANFLKSGKRQFVEHVLLRDFGRTRCKRGRWEKASTQVGLKLKCHADLPFSRAGPGQIR